ncbi:MAG: hypothetical protein HYZ28_00035 [Myxococcales bacterium]|nr:hypothetical protein [Myxococcales bacterium]
MSRLGPAVASAFHVAAGELGMCSAAWLFVREVAAEGGEPLVSELRDLLGRAYPVLDAVAGRWLEGSREPKVGPDSVLAACEGASRLLVVGIEAMFLDALLPKLGQTRATLLAHSSFPVDWERVVANHERRLETVELSSLHRLAGRRSALLTFLYGTRGESTWVDPAWLRVMGADVRTQFRSIVGWDVLGSVMYLYPRWLSEAPASDFSHLVRA